MIKYCPDQYKNVILAVFKYLSMMRSSPLPEWYQHEIAEIRDIRFKFQEKRSPDDYATWISEHMAWPVPREQIFSGHQLVEEWNGKDGEQEVRNILDSLRIENGRVLLMAKKEEHERLAGVIDWEEEPIYGTRYRVERFDTEFISKVRLHETRLYYVNANFSTGGEPQRYHRVAPPWTERIHSY